MRSLRITEAARLLQTSPQGTRELIKNGKINGACCYGSKKHLTYYITDEQIRKFMKGESAKE